MIGKAAATTTILLAGLIAFLDNVLESGYVFGAVFVLLAVLTWSQWAMISAAFRSAKDESELPIIRLSSNIIGGMRRMQPTRRPSSP